MCTLSLSNTCKGEVGASHYCALIRVALITGEPGGRGSCVCRGDLCDQGSDCGRATQKEIAGKD